MRNLGLLQLTQQFDTTVLDDVSIFGREHVMDQQSFQGFAGTDEIHRLFPIGNHRVSIAIRIRAEKAYVS